MGKGHRRTQSDTIHINQRTTYQPIAPNSSLSHVEITKLLTICNQKVKQKVSNIQVLAPLPHSESQYFQFGHKSHKRLYNASQNYQSRDYLACIPQKKQSFHRQSSEILNHFVKKLEIKEKRNQQDQDQKCRRFPFSEALNSKPRDRRKAEPEKLPSEKNPTRNKLGLKMKF